MFGARWTYFSGWLNTFSTFVCVLDLDWSVFLHLSTFYNLWSVHKYTHTHKQSVVIKRHIDSFVPPLPLNGDTTSQRNTTRTTKCISNILVLYSQRNTEQENRNFGALMRKQCRTTEAMFRAIKWLVTTHATPASVTNCLNTFAHIMRMVEWWPKEKKNKKDRV